MQQGLEALDRTQRVLEQVALEPGQLVGVDAAGHAAAGAAGYLNVFTASGNTNVANGFPAVSDATTKFEGATGTAQVTIAYYARLREAA